MPSAGGDITGGAYGAVLFDLDGTLAETDLAHGMAYKAAFADIGIFISEYDFRRFAGQHAEQVIVGLSGGDEAIDRASLHESKTRYFAEMASQFVEPLPLFGLACTLKGLVPIGIVTSASRKTTQIILDSLSMGVAFDAMVTGDDVVRHKPDPEPYETACRMLGVGPDRCLVFEDSASGFMSAQAAGLSTIWVEKNR